MPKIVLGQEKRMFLNENGLSVWLCHKFVIHLWQN